MNSIETLNFDEIPLANITYIVLTYIRINNFVLYHILSILRTNIFLRAHIDGFNPCTE